MRSPRRGIAATTSALVSALLSAVVAVSLPALGALVAPAPATAAEPGGGVVLNEVKSNPGDDFVELLNTGDAPVDITGWRAVDDDPAHTPIVVTTAPTVLAPGEYFTFNPDAAALAGHFGLGKNDEITIFLADGTTEVDFFTWEGIGAPGEHANPSYGRCENGSGAMVLNLSATPGATNDCPPVVTPADLVRINEVESNGDPVADWVELTNTGSTAVDVSGWKLRDGGATNPTVAIPSGTTIAAGGFYAVYTELPGPGFGLGTDDEITLSLADGTTEVDQYAWTGGHAATTYGRCPDGTGDFRVTTVSTRGAANACSPIRLNEVDTASTPDRVEIVNLSDAAVDLAGWVVKDSTETAVTTLPASTVPAHGYLVVQPTATLDPADSVRLLDDTGALIDSVSWTTAPSPSFGRCADGVGAFTVTAAATLGTVNQCRGLETAPWPGSQAVSASDDAPTLGQDASGLAFDPTSANTLWVAQNKLGTLWRMTRSGSTWVPSSGWAGGRNPLYSSGTGAPDTEGITVTPDGAVYLAAERDNSASGVSRNTVLRYDAASATGATLTATDEWALNPVLPTVGANLGLEGITWVPDSALVAGGFVDDSTHAAYTPSTYPSHGAGLFVVAVEGTGLLYVLALDQTPAVQEAVHLVATVDPELIQKSGSPGVMDVSWDPELQRLWAICDDGCDGTSVQLALRGGDFVVDQAYDRPAGMPNLNNEGFALAPQSTCVAGAKEVVWADDGDTDGHALRSGTFPCTAPPSTGTPGGGGGGTGAAPAPEPAAPAAAIVTGAPTSVAYGRSVTVPVSVTATGAVPTGTVTLRAGSRALGSATLNGGSGVIALPVKALEPGIHQLTAAYAGDHAVAAGSGGVTVTVTRARAIVVKPVVKPREVVVDRTRATLLITVRATGVVPTGRVTISGGGLKKETATLTGGKAKVRLARFDSRGAKKLTVTYRGDDHVTGASTTITVGVKPAKRR